MAIGRRLETTRRRMFDNDISPPSMPASTGYEPVDAGTHTPEVIYNLESSKASLYGDIMIRDYICLSEADIKPAVEKRQQLPGRLDPEIGGCRAFFRTDQNTESVASQGHKRIFIGAVVAQIGDYGVVG